MKILIGRSLIDTKITNPVAVKLSKREAELVIQILQESLKENRDNGDHFFFHDTKSSVERKQDMMQKLKTEPMV